MLQYTGSREACPSALEATMACNPTFCTRAYCCTQSKRCIILGSDSAKPSHQSWSDPVLCCLETVLPSHPMSADRRDCKMMPCLLKGDKNLQARGKMLICSSLKIVIWWGKDVVPENKNLLNSRMFRGHMSVSINLMIPMRRFLIFCLLVSRLQAFRPQVLNFSRKTASTLDQLVPQLWYYMILPWKWISKS